MAVVVVVVESYDRQMQGWGLLYLWVAVVDLGLDVVEKMVGVVAVLG